MTQINSNKQKRIFLLGLILFFITQEVSVKMKNMASKSKVERPSIEIVP